MADIKLKNEDGQYEVHNNINILTLKNAVGDGTTVFTVDTGLSQVKYPYTYNASYPSQSSQHAIYFTQSTFGNPTTSSGYGSHSISYLSINNASVALPSYSKLYYLTNNNSAETAVPDGTQLYIKKESSYTMGSQPFSSTDSCVMLIGTYNATTNEINFTSASSLCGASYNGWGNNIQFNIFALIGSTYRTVYFFADLGTFVYGNATRLSETAIGNSWQSETYAGTTYKYTLSQSYYSTSTSLYWQRSYSYKEKQAVNLAVYNTDWGTQYLYGYYSGINKFVTA